MTDHWLVPHGTHVDLRAIDPADTHGGPAVHTEAQAAVAELQLELASLQDRLWAEASRSVLMVLQGTDASGKDGTIRHVFTALNPQALSVTGFREPTPVELRHDFLWRIHRAVPEAGQIGIFNRSHYEDVVAVRVRGLVPEKVWSKRFEQINAFEHLLAESGTTIVKLFLHISRAEQGERFAERAAAPDKRWKLRPEDFADRERWDEFTHAYSEALTKTNTHWAPWRVIPADHKWFRNWAVSTVLLDVLRGMDPKYPVSA